MKQTCYLISIECMEILESVHLILKSRGYIFISETKLSEKDATSTAKYLIVIEGIRARQELILTLKPRKYEVISQTEIPEPKTLATFSTVGSILE